MYVFKRKSVISEVQFVMFSSRALATRIGGCSFSSITSAIYWILTQTKLSSINRRTFLCLDEASLLLAIQTELKLAKCFYSAVAIDSRAKSWQTCGKSREGALVPVLLRITHWPKSGLPVSPPGLFPPWPRHASSARAKY